MGTNRKACFLGGMGIKRLVVSQGRKVGFSKKIQQIIFLVVWDGVVEERGWVYLFFFFCDMVT
jgi:hypothetical protein